MGRGRSMRYGTWLNRRSWHRLSCVLCGGNSTGSLLCLLVVLTPAALALPADVVKPVVETKANIAFVPADLGETTYNGWIADRMNINVEKRLLQLDLDMILDPFANRPGPQWWVGKHVGKYLHAATYAWRYTGDERLRKCADYAVTKLIDTQLPNGYLGTLKGKPALLQYVPGKHALHFGEGDNRNNVSLHVRGNYPQTGDLEIEVDLEEVARFPLVLRVPAWAKGFEATVDGKRYRPSRRNRLLEIIRTWLPGDTVRIKIPLSIRVIPDGDKTTESVAFVRGPQVLATNAAIRQTAVSLNRVGGAMFSTPAPSSKTVLKKNSSS